MATTPHGLQLVNLGTYIEDPAADDLLEFASKVNYNSELIDPLVQSVDELDTNMNSLEAKGLVAGVIYGGTF